VAPSRLSSRHHPPWQNTRNGADSHMGLKLRCVVLRKFSLVLICMILAFSAGLAEAAKPKKQKAAKVTTPEWDLPMVFSHVRSSEPGCEPTCAEWISAEGRIVADTANKLKAVLDKTSKRKLPMVIYSPGGDVTAAMAMGRLLRARKIDVAVGWTYYDGCKPRDKKCKPDPTFKGRVQTQGAYCNSACPVAISGGISRFVAPSTKIGVHRVKTIWTQERITYRETYTIKNGKKKVLSRKEVKRTKLKPKVTTGIYAELNTKLTKYYNDMGIDPAIIVEAEKTPASKIANLSTSSILKYRIATGAEGADILASSRACKARRENCVTR
jgi:hypothetical protein